MANRISHSQLRLFSECGKKYEYYYQDRIRETTKSGALFFGSAMDKAFEALCKGAKKEDALTAYYNAMHWGDINGKVVNIPTEECLVYGKTDYDSDLLDDTPEKQAAIEAALEKKQNWAGHWGLTQAERLLINDACWRSLYRKGLILIDALVESVMPRIKEVVATQKKLELTNGADSLIGFPDLICRLDDGLLYLLDLKTSSRPYDTDSVATSQQLTIYDEALKQEGLVVDKQGFIVLLKKLKKTTKKTCKSCGFTAEPGARAKTCTDESSGKRCGGAWNESVEFKGEVQWVLDTIPERSKDIILENVDNINHAIENKVFTRNFSACEGNFGRCAYFDLCWKNKMDHLTKLS